ncbi:MAG: hypothetical protein KDC52_17495 [Ignavibacteriae bacterium]|nr:hypothetical protein [Ignavibacteriota bacterium]MCB0753270.1 hypothetical protein [Ignavibacteriota bacterium]
MEDIRTSNYNQITLKVNKKIATLIRKIAKREERTIQTVTNRLLIKAISEYENSDVSTDDFEYSLSELSG